MKSYGLKSVLDVGCGVGYFSRYLFDLGLKVTGIDARPENISEAEQRHPQIKFKVYNIENNAVQQLGLFDLVLCFGLLYHLENPFAAVRNLCALTKGVLVIESVIVPGALPIARLLEDGQGRDQSLQSIALIPSESCLVKMLYRAGFSHIYKTEALPDHEDFQETIISRQKRTMLAATKNPVYSSSFLLVSEPARKDPWIKFWALQSKRVTGFLCNRFRFLRNGK